MDARLSSIVCLARMATVSSGGPGGSGNSENRK